MAHSWFLSLGLAREEPPTQVGRYASGSASAGSATLRPEANFSGEAHRVLRPPSMTATFRLRSSARRTNDERIALMPAQSPPDNPKRMVEERSLRGLETTA